MRKQILLVTILLALVVAAAIAFTLFRTPEAASSAPTIATVTKPVSSADTILYRIDTANSEARFVIDEVLRNVDTTVVGATNQVSGEIALDPEDVPTSVVGEILINARTLVTDNNFRNRALNNRILLTAQHEHIRFVPTQMVGLPAAAEVGQTYTFQIVGDLTIIGQTREVTFDTQATLVSDMELTGLATTTLKYDDFGITIPFATAVQAVAEDVTLELEFTARAG